MECEGYNQELLLAKVREKLNGDQVKLWLPPYTTETQERGEIPLDMITRYSKDLTLTEEIVAKALESLRLHALTKLDERKKFQTTGIATVKVRVAAGRVNPVRQILALEMSLDKCGADLRQAVSAETGLEKAQLKLISAGKVLEDKHSLQAQNIKHGSQVMAVVMTETEAGARKEEKQIADVSRTREAAELLSTRADGDDDDVRVQIADQGGRALDLPKEETKALTLAMTLHEKGRAALKRKNYSKALLLLLEADKEFGNCRAQILDMVDNFAILCLDIVWCYLCLENVSELPDAERRLSKCEAMFIKSYGVNNERLKVLKNGAEVERILLMRLHLLQGIVSYHQHKTAAAQQLMRQAMDEFNMLQVNPEAIAHLMELGFSSREARLGMRACVGNVAAAAEYVMKQRLEREELMKKDKQEKEDRKLAKKYGNCANGNRLDMQNVYSLMKMDFARGPAAEALKQTNNNLGAALDLLQEHPELLCTPDVIHDAPIQLSDRDIAQIVALGFDPSAAQIALRRHRNSVQRAVDDLIKYNGVLPYSSDESESGSSSSGSESPGKSDARKKRREENEVLDELMSDMTRDETDHLDFEMTEERQFLDEYLARLSSL